MDRCADSMGVAEPEEIQYGWTKDQGEKERINKVVAKATFLFKGKTLVYFSPGDKHDLFGNQ